MQLYYKFDSDKYGIHLLKIVEILGFYVCVRRKNSNIPIF